MAGSAPHPKRENRRPVDVDRFPLLSLNRILQLVLNGGCMLSFLLPLCSLCCRAFALDVRGAGLL